MSITAKELARKLGLSEAAVSLALNNRPGVSTATRKRVMDTAKEFGYDFSRKAVSGIPKKGTVGLIIYKKSGAVVDDTPFFSALTDGVSIGCKKADYDLLIRYLYEDEDLKGQLNLIQSSGLSGIILLATEMEEHLLSSFSDFSIPLVILDAYFEKYRYNYISINNIQGAYLATNYLITRLRTQPGYLRSSYRISNFDERADGFYKAIRSHGMSSSKSLVHALTPSQEGAYSDMRQLLLSGEVPARCYFADNDLIALGAIRALKEASYRIPEDVAVVGFDDIPLCEYTDPPLTTIEVPKHYMGETAAERLVRLMEETPSYPLKIQVSTSLKRRKSV